jgi:Ran GTPase-activating protein (RanGAP) involved in mRNA processing and transport
VLLLQENSLDDTTAHSLANALVNDTRLKVLSLSNNPNITTAGWQALFGALQSPHCILQRLHLQENDLEDFDVSYLVNSLASNHTSRCLDMYWNHQVTSLGWRTFSAILQNSSSSLQKIDLRQNIIDDDTLSSLAHSLMRNTKLKELLLDEHLGSITITGWDAISNVLCDKSSIDATFNSNHTLQYVVKHNYRSEESILPSDLITLLRLNRENTKIIEAARRKTIEVHFSLQTFIDMDLKTLPYAVAWMAKDGYGSSLLYQFVLNTTLFHDVRG